MATFAPRGTHQVPREVPLGRLDGRNLAALAEECELAHNSITPRAEVGGFWSGLHR